MKKLLLIFSLLLLTSCFNSNSSTVDNAKKELLNPPTAIDVEPEKTEDENSAEFSNSEDVLDALESNLEEEWEKAGEVEVKKTIVKYITSKKFISIDDIDESKITAETEFLKIVWSVIDTDVDKIEVVFSNTDSSFPDDYYVLTKFKKWDTSFEYNANKKYKVLDTGVNNYVINAYKWSELAQVRVSITIDEKWEERGEEESSKDEEVSENVESDTKTEVSEPETTEVEAIEEVRESNEEVPAEKETSSEAVSTWTWYVMQTLGEDEDSVYLKIPTSNELWEVKLLSDSSFTYSNVDWLVVKRDNSAFTVTCDNVTEHLQNMYSFSYWNTCRPINGESWISFNTLWITKEWYTYERHYLDKTHGLYSIIVLETGEWIDADNIADKNREYKTKDFWAVIGQLDKAFEEIVK